MDEDLVLIFMFVIAIVIIGVTAGQLIHRRTVRHEERKLELQARIEEAKAAQGNVATESQAHLEDRMRVLERIVTDPSNDLSRQIEGLRELSVEKER